MEPLSDVAELAYEFKPKANSTLKSLIDSIPAAPRRQSSSAATASSNVIPFDRFGADCEDQDPTPDPEEESSINDVSERLKKAMKNFTDGGDSDEIIKELEEIVSISLSVPNEKREFIKAMEAVMDDFLEPEEKGGLPKENIQECVERIVTAQQAIVAVQVDQQILRDLISVIRDLPNALATKPPREDEDDQSVEDEEIDDEQPNPEHPMVLEKILAIRQDDYLTDRRMVFNPMFCPERNMHVRTLDKLIAKIREKRGYDWKIVNGEVVFGAGQIEEDLRGVVTETARPDPITKGVIQDPVRSKFCVGPHTYDRTTITQFVTNKPQGVKCSYRGCDKKIRFNDLIDDEEYARILNRLRARGEVPTA